MPDNSQPEKRRVVFAVTGASGMPLAQAVLGHFHSVSGLEIHLIISRNAELTLEAEMRGKADAIKGGHYRHSADDPGAPPASGSWLHSGMVVCPCSMASLAAIANGFGHNLVSRAADVCLKERRPLILVCRESPLNLIHLRNMVVATEAGAVIMPFAPAFYTGDNSMEASFCQFAGRILDLLHIPSSLCRRWEGLPPVS